jgi:dihydrodipicolinate synthase/N-acetylneuraminate lyase
VVGSGSGEGYALTRAERDRIMAVAVEELKGRVPVRAMGCEPRLIDDMIEFLQAAERADVDAAQIFSLEIGHGSKPTREELERYYCSVIESTRLPLYLSSHHASGYFLPLDLIARLADRYPHLTGIAYGGSDLDYLASLIRRMRGRLDIHCAGAYNAMTVLALGGNAFMGPEGNLAPQLCASVIAGFATRDPETLRIAFDRLLALWAITNRYGGSMLRGLKPLMNAYGLPAGVLRSPRLPVNATDLKDMIAAVAKLEIPELAGLHANVEDHFVSG